MFGFLGGFVGTALIYRVVGGKGSGGSLFALILAIIFYIKIENLIIANCSAYLIEMLIAYVFLTILLFKFSYKINTAYPLRSLTYGALFIINIPLVVCVSLVFFNTIKHTPFSLIIDWFNLFGIESNNFIEAICEIIGYSLKSLDILVRTLGFLFIQNLIITICQKKHIKKLDKLEMLKYSEVR